MNREQAEHILDAYVRMKMSESDKDASDALREVILDVMTEYRAKTIYPNITYPHSVWVDTTKQPTNWDGTPKVTCTGTKVTGTGIDPALGINPAAVEGRAGGDA